VESELSDTELDSSVSASEPLSASSSLSLSSDDDLAEEEEEEEEEEDDVDDFLLDFCPVFGRFKSDFPVCSAGS
jgi:hypothetical protein